MGFFDVPSFTPAPPVQQPDPPWPVWMKPEVVLPGVVAGEQLLASAERARTWTRVRCRRPGVEPSNPILFRSWWAGAVPCAESTYGIGSGRCHRGGR